MPRNRYDPLSDTARPHWLTIAHMYGERITCEALPAGADLREALRDALARCAEGWQPEGDGAHGFTFIAKGGERRLLNLTPADPAEGFGRGHSFLAGSGALS